MARQQRTNGTGRLRSASALRPECADSPLLMDAAGNGGTTALRRRILRPYATAGVAIVGTGLIAVAPAPAPLPDLQVVRDVALTAGGLPDLAAPWEEVFNTASQNTTTLLNNFFLAPGVGVQQFLVNQGDFWQQFLDDPTSSTLADINAQIQDNLNAVLTGYTLQGANGDISFSGATGTLGTTVVHTLDAAAGGDLGGHMFLFSQLPSFLPADIDSSTVVPIVNFLASPLSGIIMGALGPSISPWIALMNSMNDGDGLNEIIANMVGAYFNGATLDLSALTPVINHAGFFPPGLSLGHLEVAFGGLLSPGSVAVGPYGVEGTDVAIPAVGGSIFNSLGLQMNGVPVLGQIDLAGVPIGPIGAWEAWGQTVGALLGSGWDGKGPVDVTPPGIGLDLPTVPADFLDDGGAGDAVAGADGLTDWFGDLLGLFA